MFIREMSLMEFKDYAEAHFIGNCHQTINYALLKAEEGYNYELICLEGEEIKAAALILYKKIGNTYYGYSPRGFLIDYSNLYLLNEFTEKIKEYYKKKNFTFIKINPSIAVSKLDIKSKKFIPNNNINILNNLKNTGYLKLKDNMAFEAALPRINAIVNLEQFDINTLKKNTRNKVKKGIRKGLILEKATLDKLEIFYSFIKNKIKKNSFYYNDLYNVFSKTGDVDLLLVKVDYKEFLINSQQIYNLEMQKNQQLNEKLIYNNNPKIINTKMNSDRALISYKNDIAEAAKNLNENIETYVAGAIVLKHQNRVMIEISGFDKKFARYSPNYFLYYAILNYYKKSFKYADLNGITADLSITSDFYGLNQFKLGFNPDVYEFIGEFDLIIDENSYKQLLKTGLLAKEFNKN